MVFIIETKNQRPVVEAWVEWLSSDNYDFAFTVNFNRETTLIGAERKLRQWARSIDRKVLGRRWNNANPEKRVKVIGFPEHPNSNLHYHLLVHTPVNPLKAQRLAVSEWKRLVKSGDLWASALGSQEDVRGFAKYAAKDAAWNGVGVDHAVIIHGE